MTDAIRGNLLEYCGYKTQILEFIDFTHTPKNLLIRGVKSKIPDDHKKKLLNEVENLIKEYNLQPTLYELLIKKQWERNDNQGKGFIEHLFFVDQMFCLNTKE